MNLLQSGKTGVIWQNLCFVLQRSIRWSYQLPEFNRPTKLYCLAHCVSLATSEHWESNPRLFGYKPKALPLSYVPLCVSISRVPAFKALIQCITYDYFYFRRASASYLLVGRYPTSWGREELNLQCLPRGNGFTVRRNTANRCRFPGISYTLRHSRRYASACQPCT